VQFNVVPMYFQGRYCSIIRSSCIHTFRSNSLNYCNKFLDPILGSKILNNLSPCGYSIAYVVMLQEFQFTHIIPALKRSCIYSRTAKFLVSCETLILRPRL
jgi:hypothetical protein